MTAEASGKQAEDLAATMLSSTLGLDFDPEAAWNERKRI
jgi:arginine decarboxylase